MARICKKISLGPFKKEHGIRTIQQIELFYDVENAEKILGVISENKNRFERALFEIVNGRYNNDLYGKENFSTKTQHITAIKFKKSHNNNYRIYCKEYHDDKVPNRRKIVMAGIYNKKSQKLTKTIKTYLNSISEYEYEFKE